MYNFIDLLLIVSFICLVILYIKQNRKEGFINHYTRKKRKNNNNFVDNKEKINNKFINDKENSDYEEYENNMQNLFNEDEIKKCVKQNNLDYFHSQQKKADLVEFTNGKTHIGPVKNFHQCFNNDNFKNNDLGWRKFINNYNNFDTKMIKNRKIKNNDYLKNIYL